MRNEYCLEHIDQIIESCGLSDRTNRELKQVMEFRSKHGEISPLSNGAIMPLIRIKDPETQSKAIEAVVKELESGTGARVTAEKVKKRVQDVVGPKPAAATREAEEPTIDVPAASAPRSGALTYNKRAKIHILQTHLMDDMGKRYTKDVYRFEPGTSEKVAKQALADFNAGGSKVLDMLLLDDINFLLAKGFARSEILNRITELVRTVGEAMIQGATG